MNNTVEPFIDLVRRHESRFYTFVHSVHANDTTGIFDGLLTYIDSILGGMSHGLLTKRIDLDTLIATHVPPAEQSILAAEIDAVCEYHLARKARRLERIRRRTEAAAAAEGRGLDIEMESVFKEMGGSNEEVNGVLDDVRELQFDSDEDEDEEWEEMELQADDNDDGVEAVTSKFNASKWWKGKDTAETEVKPPALVIIPKLVKPFVEVVVTGLGTE
ncbi:hypothetical protein BC937DRAFT_87198 [Endogone sp. FLAS-F59071]|nr:hypothetical protein BC937DRAFT_87198 [Endogone sp. FLAS-F59071]|eukprot:RUS12717.1 hypothetical protein BC937DRAFT_87198 [Endogone sp. FLAS-F59071]